MNNFMIENNFTRIIVYDYFVYFILSKRKIIWLKILRLPNEITMSDQVVIVQNNDNFPTYIKNVVHWIIDKGQVG